MNVYKSYVLGFICGAFCVAISFSMQPRNVNHYLTITKPIQAEVKLEAVTKCIDGPDCIVSD